MKKIFITRDKRANINYYCYKWSFKRKHGATLKLYDQAAKKYRWENVNIEKLEGESYGVCK